VAPRHAFTVQFCGAVAFSTSATASAPPTVAEIVSLFEAADQFACANRTWVIDSCDQIKVRHNVRDLSCSATVGKTKSFRCAFDHSLNSLPNTQRCEAIFVRERKGLSAIPKGDEFLHDNCDAKYAPTSDQLAAERNQHLSQTLCESFPKRDCQTPRGSISTIRCRYSSDNPLSYAEEVSCVYVIAVSARENQVCSSQFRPSENGWKMRSYPAYTGQIIYSEHCSGPIRKRLSRQDLSAVESEIQSSVLARTTKH
jgi:hypothetical protein